MIETIVWTGLSILIIGMCLVLWGAVLIAAFKDRKYPFQAVVKSTDGQSWSWEIRTSMPRVAKSLTWVYWTGGKRLGASDSRAEAEAAAKRIGAELTSAYHKEVAAVRAEKQKALKAKEFRFYVNPKQVPSVEGTVENSHN